MLFLVLIAISGIVHTTFQDEHFYQQQIKLSVRSFALCNSKMPENHGLSNHRGNISSEREEKINNNNIRYVLVFFSGLKINVNVGKKNSVQRNYGRRRHDVLNMGIIINITKRALQE